MTRLHVPVPVRWADLDAYGHVNNVAVLRLLEEARIAAFWRHPEGSEASWPTAVLDAAPGAATTTVVARQEIEYLLAIPHRRTTDVRADAQGSGRSHGPGTRHRAARGPGARRHSRSHR